MKSGVNKAERTFRNEKWNSQGYSKVKSSFPKHTHSHRAADSRCLLFLYLYMHNIHSSSFSSTNVVVVVIVGRCHTQSHQPSHLSLLFLPILYGISRLYERAAILQVFRCSSSCTRSSIANFSPEYFFTISSNNVGPQPLSAVEKRSTLMAVNSREEIRRTFSYSSKKWHSRVADETRHSNQFIKLSAKIKLTNI